jgi:hypothetical protein
MNKHNQILWIAGVVTVFAALYLSTKSDVLPERELAVDNPPAPRQSEHRIRPESRAGLSKPAQHKVKLSDTRSQEYARVKKKLEDLYASTFDTEKRPFDGAIYAPHFKKFLEEEGLDGLRALSESHSIFRLTHDPKFFDLELLLPKIIRESYLSGTLGSMVDVLEAMRLEDSSKDGQASEHLLTELMNGFGLDQVNSVRIFEELCSTLPEQGYGPYFVTIASHAGRWMGYDKALMTLDNSPAFEDYEVQNSLVELIGAWIFRDEKSCKAFIDSLPEGQSKNRYLAAFGVGMAGHGKSEKAEAILAGLPANSKELREARQRIKKNGNMPHR